MILASTRSGLLFLALCLGAVAVVEVPGERVFESASGKRYVAADADMQLDTIFRIYSMTKPVTAVAALLLCEQGKLELDSPVAEYLPEFEGLGVGIEKQGANGETILEGVPAERPMSLRDLARHTAGLTYGVFVQSAVDTLVLKAQCLQVPRALTLVGLIGSALYIRWPCSDRKYPTPRFSSAPPAGFLSSSRMPA